MTFPKTETLKRQSSAYDANVRISDPHIEVCVTRSQTMLSFAGYPRLYKHHETTGEHKGHFPLLLPDCRYYEAYAYKSRVTCLNDMFNVPQNLLKEKRAFL